MDSRGIVDTLVQRAMVDLFQSYGVALAPSPRLRAVETTRADVVGTIRFSGRGLSGMLTLSVPEGVLVLMNCDASRPFHALDWVRELTNQLMGRIKNRLLHFQLSLQVGLPSAMKAEHVVGAGPERRPSEPRTLLVYPFRTIRDDVIVTLDGVIDESSLSYTGGLNLAREGDIIMF